MFHTYEEAVDWIHTRLRLGIKPGLKRMEWMMERLNHPERRMKSVHIGGTNGKGSTVAYLRSILQQAGYQVGTFTSPYFEHFNERISKNGVPINDEDIIQLVNIIYPLALELEKTELGGPSEFEIITAMAMVYFSDLSPVDIVIFEVGLGGRWDSTNIIYPLISIITSIGLDHTNILGNTYEEIAFEKAGIIKNGISLVTAVKQVEALEVIKKSAQEKKAPFYELNHQFEIIDHHSLQAGEAFSLRTVFETFHQLEISMVGKHQVENASLAVMASILLKKYYSFMIEETHIQSGLKAAYWPGRFEFISQNPVVIIDGAHNEEGIEALVSELKKRYQDKKIHIVFSALRDKKLDKMIWNLDQVADKIMFVEFDFPRASKAEDLFHISTSNNKDYRHNWKEAIQEEWTKIKEKEILVITGSLYFLSDVKPYIMNLIK